MNVCGTFDTAEEAFQVEQALIKYHGRRDMGTGGLCNHSDGGEGPINYVHTPEAKRKMSAAKMGNTLNVGRKRPDMIERFSKPVSMYDVYGRFIKTFESGRDAEKFTGAKFGQISACCLRKIKTTTSRDGKVTFRFGFNKELK